MFQVGIASLAHVGSFVETGLNDGDPVDSWTDSSGNGRTATQSGSSRPTFKTAIVNGMPVVRFTSSGTSSLNFSTSISGVAPWTVFTVMKPTGTSVFSISIGSTTAVNPFGPLALGGNVYVASRSGYGTLVGDLSGGWYVVVANTPDGAAFNWWTNGGTAPMTTGSLGATTADFNVIGMRAGTPDYSDADIAEVIIYNVVVGSTDRANVEKYLGTKYGITVAGGSAVQPNTVSGLQGWWKADSL